MPSTRLATTPNELQIGATEEFRTMEFAEILRAGWAFALTGYQPWTETRQWSISRCRQQLNELLLKALELTEIRRWVEGK